MTHRILTYSQSEEIFKQAKEMLKKKGEGVSVRDIMAEVYVESMDDKTMQQGYMMADAIIESVERFDKDYKEALENSDKFIKSFQKRVEKGKSKVEACEYWLGFIKALEAAEKIENDENFDIGAAYEEGEKIKVSEEEATDEYLKELRKRAEEMIKTSPARLAGFKDCVEELEAIQNGDEAARLLLDFGAEQNEFREMASMIAYIHIKQGEYINIPVDVNAGQVSVMVCTSIEQMRIYTETAEERMAIDVATEMLEVLGIIGIVEMAVVAYLFGMAVFAILLPGLLFIPAAIVFTAAVLGVMCAAYDEWEECAEVIVKSVVVGIKAVVKGAKKVAAYIADLFRKDKKKGKDKEKEKDEVRENAVMPQTEVVCG